MMQPANHRDRNRFAQIWRFDFSLERRVPIQRQVRSCVMIVVEVRPKNSQQVPFIENHEMIKAFAMDRSDESLDVRRLPWRTVCDHDLLDTHVLDTLPEVLAVDRIPIVDAECVGLT